MVATGGMSEAAGAAESREPAKGNREFLKYTFYKVRPEWRILDGDARAAHKAEFAALLHALANETVLRTYSLVGIRGDADFMMWIIADRLESLADIGRRVSSTALGKYLETPYAYLSMRRKSIYLGGHKHAGQEGEGRVHAPVGSKYLFVYPFTKKREWYSLPFEERQRMMRDHFRVGHRFPKVTIHTGYSFGLDDQEFTLAFESDSPSDFLDLVMELRSSDASRYTAVETPIFTCIAADPDSLMSALGE